MKTVLVYQIGSLGDTIVSVPAYRAVRRHFGPDARILVLHNAPADARAVPHQVLDGSGLVDGAITYQQHGGRGTWKTWTSLWTKLRKVRADAIVYVAPGERSASSVKRDDAFFKLCGIRERLGFHACDPALFEARAADGRRASVEQEAFLRLGRLERDGIVRDYASDLAIPLLTLPAAERDKAMDWLHQQASDRPFVAVCPGANQSAKFWPMERFEEIGKRLIAGGYEPIVIGGALEKEMGERLLAAWGRGVNAAGQFSVMGSAALLGQCRLLVGLDTGTTHMAAALDIPSVVLFADRTRPRQWEPLGDRYTLIRKSVPCGGCLKRDCPVEGHPCMTAITVDEVWAAIQAVLQPLLVK